MAYFENLGIEVYFDDGGDETDILIVGDSASVVDFWTQKVEHFVWNLLILIQKHSQLFLAHHQILICELVGDVPADRTEFTAILNDGMEETKSE